MDSKPCVFIEIHTGHMHNGLQSIPGTSIQLTFLLTIPSDGKRVSSQRGLN